MRKVSFGGDRVGSGDKRSIELKSYERSTHDLSYAWRSSMACGTLVPFMGEIATPGTTFDIDLDIDVKTLPTTGPLFGSYKVQADVYLVPIRLYQGKLFNNLTKIGLKMSDIKLPIIELKATANTDEAVDIDNCQIEPSCIFSYLGIRGVGFNDTAGTLTRTFHALKFLAYWDIYKCYYANKQEEIGAVIHSTISALNQTVDQIEIDGNVVPTSPGVITINSNVPIEVAWTGSAPGWEDIIFDTSLGQFTLLQMTYGLQNGSGIILGTVNWTDFGDFVVYNWRYRNPNDMYEVEPAITTFPLENIDEMRMKILEHTPNNTPFNVNDADLSPYNLVLGATGNFQNMSISQEGLGLKTYQSDLFNNWLNKEWIDGTNGVAEVSKVSTVGNEFKIDALLLAMNVWKMLNRIAVSGGSYYDWITATYDHEAFVQSNTPMYTGGLSKELVFQEVISQSSVAGEGTGQQPLGTLAGKGVMSDKHKGGNIRVKCSEPSYVMGIVSITPRIDYSQGNRWDVNLETMDDLHKPQFDQIGFQNLSAENAAWWSTYWDTATSAWKQRMIGKQTAWIHYQTNYSQTYGNFAVPNREMFMTLNRKYQAGTLGVITDMTSYIDPTKFNNIFAYGKLDAQNFWVQIGVKLIARRKMSAHQMPNI